MRNLLLLSLTLIGLLLLSGCNSGSSAPPPPLAMAVSLSPSASQAIDQGQTKMVTATVSNDSSNKGVTWNVTCPAMVTSCGAMAQTTTPSGTPNTYNGPANVTSSEAVTLTATSMADTTKSASVIVTVYPTPTLTPPPNNTLPTVTVGVAYSFDLTTLLSGGASPFTWTINSGTLPAGLALNSSTGVISGTATTTATAQVNVTFVCTDSGSPPTSVQLQLTINVNPAPLAITSGAPPSGTVGTAYGTGGAGFTLTATGGITPLTWSWAAAAGSSLPPGLNIATNASNNTGLISGAPTTAGTFSVAVTVTDSQSPGVKATATFNIVIAALPALLITSGNPPNGVAGTAYGSGGNGFTLTATGGAKPFTWSWAAKSGSGSQTPPGLLVSTNSGTNNGLIAGIPTSGGSFQVTVTLTDSTMATVSADYTITITAPSGCIPGPGTLCGQFSFLAQGAAGTTDAPVMIAGTFTADGNGHITAGILDFNSDNLTQRQVLIILGPPTAYSVGQDGRGTITFSTSTAINGNGIVQFTFALNSTGTLAFIFESDDVSTTGTGNHASGYMQAVDPTKFNAASISGGYALSLLGGTSSANRPRSSAVAAVSANGSGCGLTSNGDGVWINDAGIPSTAPTSFACASGGLTTIDSSTGRGTVTIALAGAGPFSTQSLNFSFYVIDATKLIFISTDSAGLNLPILSGTMFQQLKTSFLTSDLACGFREAVNVACIFGLSGESSAGSHVEVGRAVGTSLLTLTVTLDDNNGGVVTPTKTIAGWRVSISANGLGTIVPPGTANLSSVEFVLIDTDNAILAVADGSVQAGVIRRQTAFAPSSAPGSFIFGTQLIGNGKVSNASGFVAVAAPATNATINGTIDLEQTIATPTEVPGAAFNGNYTMDSSPTGRGTGSSAAPGPSQFIIYNVGPKEIILLESDSTSSQPMLIELIQ